MPSATLPPLSPPPLVAQPTEQEAFIDQRLRQTRRQVKTVDIVVGLTTLAIGAIVYLLLVALADHWLVSGGLPAWTRWLLWLGLVGASGAFVFFQLLTPVIRRVNPVYAALTIESSQPTLRNSLINFLLLRSHKRELAAPIYKTIEQRAAADLTKVRAETAVDRAYLIRLFQILAAVLAVYCLYLVISPKNPLNSAGRILFPWSNIEAMTRVSIDDVRPGDTRAFHGEFLTVSAEIAGLSDGETPVLIYSTADGQAVDQAIPMAVPEGERRYQCTLPPGKTGLQQDYDYHITAGDCRTRRYAIVVRSAPAIVVERVVYDYPGYTGLADQTDSTGGDLRAIEGTEVTIHAVANAKIKPGSAEIDLGSTGRRGLEMSVDGLKATGRFRLKLNPDDENSPLYDSYQLRFADDEGRSNPHPVRHRIEVVRDLPPDVQVVEPKEPEVRVAENGRVAISVEAKDPDFALRRVEIRAVRDDNRSLSIAPLLDKRRPAEPVAGQFQGSFVFEPAKHGLTAGDRVQYWAVAEDNKEPAANRSETEKRWIVVESPQSQDEQQQGEKSDRPDQAKDRQQPGEKSDQRQNDDQQPQDGQGDGQPSQDPAEGQKSQDGEQSPDGEQGNEKDGQKSDENQPGDKQPGSDKQSGDGDNGKQQGDPSKSGEQEKQQGDPSKSGEQEKQRVDPEAEAGDAFQEILNDKKQQQEKQPQEKPQPDGQKQSENKQDQQENQTERQRQDGTQQQSDEQNQSGESQAAEDGSQNGNQRQDGEQSSTEEKGERQPGPGLPGENKNQPGEPKPGEQEPSGDNSSDAESNQKKNGTQKSTAEKTPGEKTESKPNGKGEKSDGEKHEGDESPSTKDADKKPNDKPGEKSPDGRGKDGETGKQQQPDNEDRGKEDKPGGDKGIGKKDLPRENPNETTDPGGQSPSEEKGDPSEKLRPDKPGDAPGDREEQETPTPAKNDDESRAKGETSGDRKGKGEKGAGQQSNQEGLGGPGSNTPADQGASQAKEPGQGETGSEAGDQDVSKTPTGSDKKAVADGRAESGKQQGETAPDGRSPAGEQSDSNEPSNQRQPPQLSDNSGIPTEQDGDSRDGVKGRAAGGKPGQSGPSQAEKSPDTGPDRANIDYARRQTELALEHLRDQLAKEKPELLDKLGWTKDDARRFLNRWEQMRRAAERQGPDGEQAKRQFDEALKSLGLRSGTELKHGGVATDSPETQRDAGRSAPPPDWADHLRAYTRGVAGEKPKK